MELDSFSFSVVVLFLQKLQVNYVAWYYIGHEHHKVVHSYQCLALGGHVCYLNLLQYGELFSFPAHVLFVSGCKGTIKRAKCQTCLGIFER